MCCWPFSKGSQKYVAYNMSYSEDEFYKYYHYASESNYWALYGISEGLGYRIRYYVDAQYENFTPRMHTPNFDLTVSVSGSGSTSPAIGSHNYEEGTVTVVTATASYGWKFSYWLHDSVDVGSTNPYKVTVNDNYSLTAVFTEDPLLKRSILESSIEVITDTSISDLVFNGTAIRLIVDGASGTTGFCNITLPKDLMSGDFSIYTDDNLLVKNVDYTETYNGTHYLFTINYEQSTNLIEIAATNVIPEFSSWIILPLLIASAILGLIYRKKLQR